MLFYVRQTYRQWRRGRRAAIRMHLLCAYEVVHSVNDLEPYCLPGTRVVEFLRSTHVSIRSTGSACERIVYALSIASPQFMLLRRKCRVSRANKRAVSGAIRMHSIANCEAVATDEIFLRYLLLRMKKMTTQRLLSQPATAFIDFLVS